MNPTPERIPEQIEGERPLPSHARAAGSQSKNDLLILTAIEGVKNLPTGGFRRFGLK